MTKITGILVVSLVLVLVATAGAWAMGGWFFGGNREAPDLDAEERTQLRELDRERYEQMTPLQEEKREIMFELRQEYLADEPDESRIEELEERLEEVRQEMLTARENYRSRAGDYGWHCAGPRGPGGGHRWGGFRWNSNGE